MSTLREGIRIWLFDREKCPRSPRCSLGTRTALIPLSNCVLVLSGSEVCPAHTGRRSWASIETYTFNVNEGATPGSSFSLVGLPALKCDGNGVSNWPQQSRSQTDRDPNRSCRPAVAGWPPVTQAAWVSILRSPTSHERYRQLLVDGEKATRVAKKALHPVVGRSIFCEEQCEAEGRDGGDE